MCPAKGGVAAGRWQISLGQARFPTWSRASSDLLCLGEDHRVMAVHYTAKGDSFTVDKPRVWSPVAIRRTGSSKPFDIAADGKQLVVIPAVDDPANFKCPVHVTVLLNFFDELKRRLP